MPSPALLAIEKSLAVAHRALWSAAQRAEALRDQGLADDLHQLAAELHRIQSSLLTTRRAA